MNESDIHDEDTLEEIFTRATDFVASNASIMQQDDLLYFYGRYKQVHNGICKERMPGIFNFKGRGKWNAWHSLGNMTKEEAMKQYVAKVAELYPEWDEDSSSEESKSKPMKRSFGPVNSTCLRTDPELKEEAKTVFDFVKEGNLNKLKDLASSDENTFKHTDENGLTLLHWACDRGHLDITEFLLSCKVNINSQDKDGQTALHYASSCGHEEVVKLLLKNGAQINLFDSDGLSAADVAYSTTIKDILTSSHL